MSSFRLRNYTPRGLNARLALLVALPVVLVFAIFAVYYYQEHIKDVNEKLSQSIAREVGLIFQVCDREEGGLALEMAMEDQLGHSVECDYAGEMTWPPEANPNFGYYDVLRLQLETFVMRPVEVRLIDAGDVLDFR
ncbi:MAG: hypothetical protein AAFQ12_14430, partial [Pseudomonadota bacterium]